MLLNRFNFINPNDPRVHTQGIEATWSAVKRSLKHLQGISLHDLDSYLYNYMFRRSLGPIGQKEIFQNMLYWIREYNGF